MQRVDIVIARYNENLDWLQRTVQLLKAKYDIKLYIYNKGDSNCNEACEQLENIGRESHTYLHHIVKHYDDYCKTPRLVVFLQGAIKDHLSSWFRGYASEHALIQAFIEDAKQKGASVSWATSHEYVKSNAAHWYFNIGTHNGKQVHPANQCFGEWFSANVKYAFPTHSLLNWWIAGLFCINSSIFTQSHTQEYYQSLKSQLVHVDPEIGHFFERSWVYITGANRCLVDIHTRTSTGKLL